MPHSQDHKGYAYKMSARLLLKPHWFPLFCNRGPFGPWLPQVPVLICPRGALELERYGVVFQVPGSCISKLAYPFFYSRNRYSVNLIWADPNSDMDRVITLLNEVA